MLAISGYIRDGEMDFLLLRPVSSQFLVSLRLLSLPDAVNVLIGLALTVYAGEQRRRPLERPPGSPRRWRSGCAALLLLYALWFATVTCAFWLVQVDTLDTLFYSVFETARYPVSFSRASCAPC